MNNLAFQAYIERLSTNLSEQSADTFLDAEDLEDDLDELELLDDAANDNLDTAEDRRRHPRYELTLAITMKGDNNLYVGLTHDISEGGVFIATHNDLPIGTSVVMSFTLPTSSQPITVRGTVRWVRGPDAMVDENKIFSSGESTFVKPGIGVQFDALDTAVMSAIRRFMGYRAPEFFD